MDRKAGQHMSTIASAEIRFLRRTVGKIRDNCIINVRPISCNWHGNVCRMDNTWKVEASLYLEAKNPRGLAILKNWGQQEDPASWRKDKPGTEPMGLGVVG